MKKLIPWIILALIVAAIFWLLVLAGDYYTTTVNKYMTVDDGNNYGTQKTINGTELQGSDYQVQ